MNWQLMFGVAAIAAAGVTIVSLIVKEHLYGPYWGEDRFNKFLVEFTPACAIVGVVCAVVSCILMLVEKLS